MKPFVFTCEVPFKVRSFAFVTPAAYWKRRLTVRAAFIVSREPTGPATIRVRGCAQAHTHQHVTAAPALSELGAEISIAKARTASGLAISDVRSAAVYDSFTITLAMLLEDLGLAKRGEAAARARSGYFSRDGEVPLNTHGGLLSYGHCGVGGAMAHLVETHLQMTGRAGDRQVKDATIALLHGDGGVLSSHVSMFLERLR